MERTNNIFDLETEKKLFIKYNVHQEREENSVNHNVSFDEILSENHRRILPF